MNIDPKIASIILDSDRITLSSILNDVLFDMKVKPSADHVQAVMQLIKTRNDASQCTEAISICELYLNDIRYE
jgi:hypothetical protein